MASKMIVAFVVALAAVGVDALACRPDSSSVALSSSTSTAILETSSTATVSTEESTSASTTSILISTTTESTSISTTTTTTTSITISTSEEPTSSTTSSVFTPCPTEGLICGDDSYVRPRPGLKYTDIGVISVEACTAACREVADCYFFLINRYSKMCSLYTMTKEEAPLQKIRGATYFAWERACFVC